MKVIVSIHDVTPAHAGAVAQLWRLCALRGVRPALLVVPDWHGQWPIDRHASFVSWVRARADDGCEILLHGERHDEAGLPRGWRDHARAVGRTAREGEFLTLSAPAARLRMTRGLATLRRIGLTPIGFVPPAWLAHRDCATVVNELELPVSEDVRAIYLHGRGMHLDSPVVRWSARTAWRAYASAAAAEWASCRHRGHWLVRIALHPRDVSHPATAASVEATLDFWLSRRIAWSYTAL